MSKRLFIDQTTVLTGRDLKAERAGLLIEDGRIAAIVRDGSMPEGGEVLDAKGATVMPGLIDCHNHLSLDVKLKDYLLRMNSSEAELAIIAVDTLARDLKSGVTASRCMGDRFYIDVLCRSLIEEGRLAGPTLKVSGIGMRSPEGHGYVGMPFGTEEELKGAIAANAEKNTDWIKYYATGIAPKDGIIRNTYSAQQVRFIIETAHSYGKPVTCHCAGGAALQDAVAAGIDCLEHIYFATDEDIEAIQKAGTRICLTPSEYFTDKPTAPLAHRQTLDTYRDEVRTCMERVAASGMEFVLGTDGSHGGLWKEAVYLKEFGADVPRILRALTVNAAALLGMDDSGEIAVGKRADLILVPGDPHEDLSVLSQPELVMKGGYAVA